MDVDRRYFNDSAEYAYINIEPGYQKLCGQKALQFARFRHEDTDLVRGVRQQEVIRATKQQAGHHRADQQARQARAHLRQVHDLRRRAQEPLLDHLACSSSRCSRAGQPIREVHFEGQVGITSGDAATGTPSYVTATDATVKKLVRQFLGVENSKGPKGSLEKKKRKGPTDGGLEKAPVPGKDQAVQAIQQGAGRPAAGLLPDASG